jgi:hypothetical protein
MAVKQTLQRIYDEVHAALWASLIVGVLYFLTMVLPQLPARQVETERLREQAVADENARYCESWGMPAGTRRNMECTFDLRQLRAKIEQETVDEFTF